MDHPQRKAWAMKHPALAKAFAVVLAVMCIVLLFGGVKGFEKAADENAERLRFEKKFSERIQNYVDLSEQLENSISYDEAYAELEKMMEEHEDAASQHKTDLAMNTAERGGNTMGANMIWEAVPNPEYARKQLEEGKAQLAAGEAQLQAVQAMYAANEAGINAVAAEAVATANGAAFSTAAANIQSIYALIETQPAVPVPPTELSQPEETLAAPETVEDPGAEPGEEATEEEKAAWQQKKDAWDIYQSALALYNENQAAWAAYNNYISVAIPQYQQSMQKYQMDYGTWAADVGAALAASGAEVEALGGTVMNISAQAMGYFSMFGVDTGAMGGGGGSAPGGEMPDISTMTPDQLKAFFSQSAGMLSSSLGTMQAGLNGVAYGLGQIGPGIAASAAQVNEMKAQLEVAEKGLAQAHSALADIWYNLGELEKEKEELAEQKLELDEEAAILSKKIMETDELRELENDHVSAKLLLTSVKEVNDMFEESDDLVGSAEKYLESYKTETANLKSGRLIVSILAIIGAVVGLAAIPAAYELVHKRFWLIWPVVICILCAAGAEAVYYFAVKEMWYVGLFTAIIAVLHLLVVAPKEKKPVVVTET